MTCSGYSSNETTRDCVPRLHRHSCQPNEPSARLTGPVTIAGSTESSECGGGDSRASVRGTWNGAVGSYGAGATLKPCRRCVYEDSEICKHCMDFDIRCEKVARAPKVCSGKHPAYLVAKERRGEDAVWNSSTDKCRRMRGRVNGSCRVRTVKEEARTYKAWSQSTWDTRVSLNWPGRSVRQEASANYISSTSSMICTEGPSAIATSKEYWSVDRRLRIPLDQQMRSPLTELRPVWRRGLAVKRCYEAVCPPSQPIHFTDSLQCTRQRQLGSFRYSQ